MSPISANLHQRISFFHFLTFIIFWGRPRTWADLVQVNMVYGPHQLLHVKVGTTSGGVQLQYHKWTKAGMIFDMLEHSVHAARKDSF